MPDVRKVVWWCTCALLAAEVAWGQGAPTIGVRPVHIGDQAVTGVVTPVPPSADGYFVRVMGGTAAGGAGGQFIDQKPITSFDNFGAFSVTLTGPLGVGQTVMVAGGGATQTVTTEAGFQPVPQLRAALHDGMRVVPGHVGNRIGVASVRVVVSRSELESTAYTDYLQIKSTGDVDSDGNFSVTLPDPLVAGQVVRAQAFTATQVGSTLSDGITVTDAGSWGRARAYFAGGVVFSKEREDFSKQDLTLTFALDKSWLQDPDFRLEADASARTAGAGKSEGAWKMRQLNSFFDTRVTALPVVQETAEGSGQNAQPSVEQFVASRKGAVMQIGVYAPIYGPQTSWVYAGAVNTFFIAPLVRLGIQTIPSASGTASVNASNQPDDIFNFWSGGVAIGHQKLSGTTNQTPEIISYLHITWGYAEAFEYRTDPGDPRTTVKPLRMLVEGRLKIPDTALQIGFDGNLGRGHDDLRFIFGTRFDIGELFGKLRSFQ